ncbi:MAG: SPFH domain-containing protein [Candidatus Borkfalkiaceae bacterium]|nr:SPFH domain-containing protein [Christensenellaceae bacterium]
MANVIDVIKYEGDNRTFIWKHPCEDFNTGSQLIVHESQEAVFFRDGKALESFGAGRHTLETQNVPRLKDHFNAIAGGKSVFHAEVYFINLTTQLGVKWGTDSKIRMFDPISGLHLELGACGTFNIKVIDGRKLLLKVVGTTSGFTQDNVFGTTSSATNYFRGMIVAKVKSNLARAIRENDINVLEVDEHTDELADILKNEINKVLDDYGMYVPEFFITNVLTPDDDPNYARLKEQHAERYLRVQQQRIKEAEAVAATKRAEAEAQLKLAVAKGDAYAEAEAKKILAGAEAEEIRLKGFAEAEVLRAKGGDYQSETARIVGKAAAENESSGAGGSIASGIVQTGVGLGVGVSVAKEVAATIKDTVSPSATWDCPACGQKNLSGNFCPNCGRKRGE